jgi:hypothetical protein
MTGTAQSGVAHLPVPGAALYYKFRGSGPLAEFPGGHSGFMLRPEAFAARLHEILAGKDALLHLHAPRDCPSGGRDTDRMDG